MSAVKEIEVKLEIEKEKTKRRRWELDKLDQMAGKIGAIVAFGLGLLIIILVMIREI